MSIVFWIFSIDPNESSLRPKFRPRLPWEYSDVLNINNNVSPLMGWESSRDTMSEIKLKFTSKEKAINYAKKNNIIYSVIEPKERKIIKKSYAIDIFLLGVKIGS